MSYLFSIFLGLTASIIWLLFFLRKDAHPESKRMILRIFFYGMLITIAAFIAEVIAERQFLNIISSSQKFFQTSPWIFLILFEFLGIALIEEFLKYLVVRVRVLKDPEFDEPTDAMLYMIIVGLGFAALENILALLPREEPFLFQEMFRATLFLGIIRFLGATFLHALVSGTVGFFLALSIFEPKKRLRLIISGLGIATLLHGLFNLSIIRMGGTLATQNGKLIIVNLPLFIFLLAVIITILVGLALFVSFGFRRLKKLASVCKTK